MVLFFARFPFMVNRIFIATPAEELQHRVMFKQLMLHEQTDEIK